MDRKFEYSPKASLEWLESQGKWNGSSRQRVAEDIVKNVRESVELAGEGQEINWEFVFGHLHEVRPLTPPWPSLQGNMIPAYIIAPTIGSIVSNMGRGMGSEEAAFLSGIYFIVQLGKDRVDTNQKLREVEEGKRGFATEQSKNEAILKKQQEISKLDTSIGIITNATVQRARRSLPNHEKYAEIFRYLLGLHEDRRQGIRKRICQMLGEGRLDEAYSSITQHQGKI